MVKDIYGGHIYREAINGDWFVCQTKSSKKIYVEAPSRKAAELLIHEVYSRDESKWTPNRTSGKFPGDRIYVKHLEIEKRSSSLEKLVEDSV